MPARIPDEIFGIKKNTLLIIGGILIFICMIYGVVTQFVSSDDEPGSAYTEVVEVMEAISPSATLPLPTDTILKVTPTQTRVRIGFVNCPDCGDLPLTLWTTIDDLGTGGEKVNHGTECSILDQGLSVEGIEKFQLGCDHKIGWLRAEAVSFTEPGDLPVAGEPADLDEGCIPEDAVRQEAILAGVIDGNTIQVIIDGLVYPVRIA